LGGKTSSSRSQKDALEKNREKKKKEKEKKRRGGKNKRPIEEKAERPEISGSPMSGCKPGRGQDDSSRNGGREEEALSGRRLRKIARTPNGGLRAA